MRKAELILWIPAGKDSNQIFYLFFYLLNNFESLLNYLNHFAEWIKFQAKLNMNHTIHRSLSDISQPTDLHHRKVCSYMGSKISTD